MRRTLTVLVASAALLVPATAASAAPSVDRVKANASCSNGKGGNGNYDPLTYNGKGNTVAAASCSVGVDFPPPDFGDGATT